ncbi:MAG: hypothetical protein H7Y18_13625 [Clostridiaceae bacterium]|nr:hypothetical protein [Clostridiaceae bacterium]
MIKLLACIFMTIDHIGIIFFPELIGFRIVGRLAMPLFSFAIARGFYYAHKHGTLATYKKRMLIFAVISQIPYVLMVKDLSGNICFLWLVCLIFLEHAENKLKTSRHYISMCLLVLCVAIVPMAYGLYGFGFTLVLYYFQIKKENNTMLYLGYVSIHALLMTKSVQYSLMQVFTLPCLPIIDILKKYDYKIKISRNFFYLFYPLHITVLLIIKSI